MPKSRMVLSRDQVYPRALELNLFGVNVFEGVVEGLERQSFHDMG